MCSWHGPNDRLGQRHHERRLSVEGERADLHHCAINKPEQYAEHHFEGNPDGEILRLKDIGQVELAPRSSNPLGRQTGIPRRRSSSSRPPGSNAAKAIEAVKEELEQIKKESFPPGHGASRSFRSIAGT